MGFRGAIFCCLVISMAVSLRARSDEPERVRPATGTVSELPKPSEQSVDTLAKHLDAAQDWLYRQMQRFFAATDMRFGASTEAPIVVPLSPVRIGIDLQFLHRTDGFDLGGAPEAEVAVALPNIERRLKVFITSDSLQETPVDPSEQHNPLSLGAGFALQPQLNAELGVRTSSSPSAFAALRWAQTVSLGPALAYLFVKPYVQSGMGIGTSGGVVLEEWDGRWMWRSTSYVDWVRNASATGWSQSLVFGYAPAVIQERRYDVFATGHDLACGVVARLTVSGDRLSRSTAYEASALMKRPIHGNWLFAYIEPLTQWNRVSGWHPDVGVRAGVDLLFWGVASGPGEGHTYCNYL
jgi:hypothetical protein